ncbi:hypothetical protein LXA43DRAFT_1093525 [Ganoderma leucocontextum]|nr:hypothetical protein LXA43DRAFT_1093525 [Ganoderma leucocontextum]
MSDPESPILRPGAFARTPFGTPFFHLYTHPEIDASGLLKRRLNARMQEEIVAWEKLQRTGELPENRSYAALLRGSVLAGNSVPVDTLTAERIVDVGRGEGRRATAASTESDDDCLWPDTYSIDSDSDIDYVVDGFVVIDITDATGSVFWTTLASVVARLNGQKSPRASGRASLAYFVL